MSRFELVKEWNESDLPGGITINRIYYCRLRDPDTGEEEEGKGWSEEEAIDDAERKLEDRLEELRE